jgi:hypothetical protein
MVNFPRKFSGSIGRAEFSEEGSISLVDINRAILRAQDVLYLSVILKIGATQYHSIEPTVISSREHLWLDLVARLPMVRFLARWFSLTIVGF